MKEVILSKYILVSKLGMLLFLFIILGIGCQQPASKENNFSVLQDKTLITRPTNALPLQAATSSKSNLENYTNTEPLDEEDKNPNTLLTATTTYKNSRAGFQITLPAGWYVSSEDNLDPHFYNCPGYDCDEAFEIQGLNLWQENNSNFIPKTYEQEIKNLKESESEPSEIKNLVPGARVLRALAPGASHGADFTYSIFYSLNKQEFWIVVKGKSFEEYILPTFKRL